MEQVNFSLLETLVFYGQLENSLQLFVRECQALCSSKQSISFRFSQHTDGFLKTELCFLEVRDSKQPICNIFLHVILANVLAEQPSSMKGFY